MIQAIYFDLFFTLIVPTYEKVNNEHNILGLSVDEWEQYAENDILYRERALGLVKNQARSEQGNLLQYLSDLLL